MEAGFTSTRDYLRCVSLSLGMLLLHPAKKSGWARQSGEWVYELFITTLPVEGFLVEDVLDLYHGRGAFEAVLADEDVEEDPDRWCSHTECGQELWQIACQWVWNLRHTTRKNDAGRAITRDRMGPTQRSDPPLADSSPRDAQRACSKRAEK
jgi:hypothetical protein